MAAEVESATSHGYAVYSQHLVVKPKQVNYIEEQERYFFNFFISGANQRVL